MPQVNMIRDSQMRAPTFCSSLIREILAAAQKPQVMSFAGGLLAEVMLPKLDWTDIILVSCGCKRPASRESNLCWKPGKDKDE